MCLRNGEFKVFILVFKKIIYSGDNVHYNKVFLSNKKEFYSVAFLIEQLKSDKYSTVELQNLINIFLVLGYPLDAITIII